MTLAVHTSDLDTIKKAAEWMRSAGCTRLVVRDSTGEVEIQMGPAPIVISPHVRPQKDDDEESTEEAKALRAWNVHWERLTYASGAPVPEFPGIEQARHVVRW